MGAIELAGFHARAGEPERVGVILAEIAAVRIKIGAFKGDQVVVVKEASSVVPHTITT